MLRESRCLKAQDADLLLLDLNDEPRICQIRSESGAPPVCSIQTQMSAVELVPFLRGWFEWQQGITHFAGAPMRQTLSVPGSKSITTRPEMPLGHQE